jgi:hypothetical protein
VAPCSHITQNTKAVGSYVKLINFGTGYARFYGEATTSSSYGGYGRASHRMMTMVTIITSPTRSFFGLPTAKMCLSHRSTPLPLGSLFSGGNENNFDKFKYFYEIPLGWTADTVNKVRVPYLPPSKKPI